MLLVPGSPVSADWRNETGTFRIGVVSSGLPGQEIRKLEGFRNLVAETLGMPVEIFPVRDAPALVDAVAASRVEYAVMSALGYATAQDICACVEPVAAPVGREGATAVRSVLVADSGAVPRISALAGQSVATGPEDSLGGDLLPAAGFRWQGRALGESGLDIVHAATTQQALRILADGDVVAAFLWEYVRPGSPAAFSDGPRAWLDEVAPDRFTVVWRSDPVRFGPHAVRREVPGEVKTALRRLLVGLDRQAPDTYDSVSPLLGGGFEAVTDDEYRSAVALVSAIKAME